MFGCDRTLRFLINFVQGCSLLLRNVTVQIIEASNASQLAARCTLNLLEQIKISKTVLEAAKKDGLPSANTVKVAANFICAATGHTDEEWECNPIGPNSDF